MRILAQNWSFTLRIDILKQELINHRHYRTRREAIEDITEYIEIFYNRQRRQVKLEFLSPVAYARKYYEGLVAA